MTQNNVKIFHRSISADGITLYLASLYYQSHRLHTEHTLIYSTMMKRKDERKRGGLKKREREG